MRTNSRSVVVLVGLVLLGMASHPLWSQTEGDFRTRVAVVPMANLTGEDAYDSIATTVTDTVGLVLRLLGSYAVTEVYDVPELAEIDVSQRESLQAIAEAQRFEEVVYGEVTRDEQRRLVFTLSLYNREEAAVKYQHTAIAPSVFDVFDAADEITIALVSEMSDMRIGFGSLEVVKTDGQGLYSIYLNGERIRNPDRDLARVLNGTYEITIHQDRLLGDTIVFRQTVDIIEDELTTVEFAIPAATAEEIAYLERRGRELSERAENAGEEEIEALLSEIAEFQNTARRAESDPQLRALAESILETATEQATQTLTALIQAGDDQYFSDDADFQSARDTYSRYASLINNVYDIRATETGSISGPVAIHADAAGEAIYVLHGIRSARLIALDANLVEVADTDTPFSASPPPEVTAPPQGGRVYATHPSMGIVIAYDGRLNEVARISLDDLPTGRSHTRSLVATDDGFLYVVQGTQVRVFDSQSDFQRDTAIEERFSAALATAGMMPSDACADDRNNIMLLDVEEARVLILNYLGEVISETELELSATRASHRNLHGFSVDPIGNYYLVDEGNHRILKFNRAGKFVTKIGTLGVDPGDLQAPQDIAVFGDGSLLVADTYNNRVQRMQLTATPIVLPEVAQLGVQFAERERTADRALERMDSVRASIKPLRPVGNFTGAIVAGGSSLGLAWLTGVTTESMHTIYEEYQAATDPGAALNLRQDVESQWFISRALMSGTILSAGIASVLVANAILTTTDYASAQRKAIGQLQALSLDAEYEVDPDRWRSLRGAQRVAVVTGVLPPLLGGAAAITLAEINTPISVGSTTFTPSEQSGIALLAGIAPPPVFGHLWGGRFHAGLALAGLVADALAGFGYWLNMSRGADWSPPVSDDGWSSWSRMWAEIQTQAPILFMTAGLGVRLTAGIYDTRNGWLETRDYNAFKAVRPIE